MPTDESTSMLSTTERSLAIAELVKERDGATLGEIRDEFGMAKSTAYKHLQTLKRLGYLTKEGEHYHVGLRFFNLGEHARYRKRGYRLAGEAIDDLSDATDEEVDFFVENAGRVISVHVGYTATNPFTREAVDDSQNHWRVGTLYEIHRLAAGKAILSGYEEDRVRAIAEQHGLSPSTEHTITDVEELLDELADIRRDGFAINNEEYAEGLCAVARRVDDADGSVLGAIVVNVPKYRFESTLDDVKEELEAAVDDLEARIETVE